MKLGIKCEIHECTIEVAKWMGNKGIVPENMVKILERDKKLRIDNQYYLKNRPVEINMDSLREFVLEMKTIADKTAKEQITKIRASLFS